MIMTIAKDAISGKRWLEGDKEYRAIVTLDGKNTFHTADWDVTALEVKGVPNHLLKLIRDYFKDRVLIYDTYDGRKSYTVSAGVLQGSVLDPILWNITYDVVLRLKLPKGTHNTEFSDDIALVIKGKHLDKLVRTCNTAVGTVKI